VHPPFGGSRKEWVCTTSEREKTPSGLDCALYHEIAEQLTEIVNNESQLTPRHSETSHREEKCDGTYITATVIAFELLAI
jgi:hypothetical protein